MQQALIIINLVKLFIVLSIVRLHINLFLGIQANEDVCNVC